VTTVAFDDTVGLDRVRERVDADVRAQVGRRRERELVVGDRHPREQVVVQHHHLHVALGVGDHRHARDLAPGAGRGRDRHEREPGAGDLVVAGEVAHLAAVVGGEHGGHLRRVDRAAAADRDHAVGVVLADGRQRALDVGDRRVGLDVAEHRGRVQPLSQRACRPLLEQELVGDHERPLDSQVGDMVGERVGRAPTDHDVLRKVQLDHRPGSPSEQRCVLRTLRKLPRLRGGDACTTT
jgi:hypothetical protein